MRRALCCIISLFAVGCTEPADDQETPTEVLTVDSQTLEQMDLGDLSFRGGLVVDTAGNRFGGWSGMEVEPLGDRLLAVSDIGMWVTAMIEWGPDNTLQGLTDLRTYPLLGRNGEPLYGKASDAEALAALGGGRFAVSFERYHRINTYQIDPNSGAPSEHAAGSLPAPPHTGEHLNNQGLTGLTALSAGRLLAAVEDPQTPDGPRTLWLRDRDTWMEISMEPQAGYGLTALSAYGDEVFGLERYYTPEDGVWVRLFSFPTAALRPDELVVPHHIATFDGGVLVDNFEAISVIERNGEKLAIVLSDSNFNDDQRTLLLAFALEARR